MQRPEQERQGAGAVPRKGAGASDLNVRGAESGAVGGLCEGWGRGELRPLTQLTWQPLWMQTHAAPSSIEKNWRLVSCKIS